LELVQWTLVCPSIALVHLQTTHIDGSGAASFVVCVATKDRQPYANKSSLAVLCIGVKCEAKQQIEFTPLVVTPEVRLISECVLINEQHPQARATQRAPCN
jgi:hypothetical protein